MTPFLIVLHILVCFFLILFVLLQPGARGGVGAAFGGAGGATVFGGRGANTFLAKLTAAAAVIFMLTSISLSFFVSRSGSVMSNRAGAAAADADAADADADAGASDVDGAADTKDAPAADAADAAAVDLQPPAAVNPGEAPLAEKPVGDAPPAP